MNIYDKNRILALKRYFLRHKNKENNIEVYYHIELPILSEESKLVYLSSICRLFETTKQRNDTRRVIQINSNLNSNIIFQILIKSNNVIKIALIYLKCKNKNKNYLISFLLV